LLGQYEEEGRRVLQAAQHRFQELVGTDTAIINQVVKTKKMPIISIDR
jgi:formiminotetrahydrofolate cyclodeaminase